MLENSLINLLSASEQEYFARFYLSRKSIAEVHTGTDKEQVSLAVGEMFRRAGYDEPALFWCQNPWQAAIMPVLIEALYASRVDDGLFAFERLNLKRLVEREESPFWEALWLNGTRQLDDLLQRKRKISPGEGVLGPNLTKIFEERGNRLRTNCSVIVRNQTKSSLDLALNEALNVLTLSKDYVFHTKLAEDLASRLAAVAAEKLHQQFEYLSLKSAFSILSFQETQNSIELIPVLRHKLQTAAKSFSWSALKSVSDLTCEFASACWPDWGWSPEDAEELRLRLSMLTSHGWAFFKNVAFLCESPISINRSPELDKLIKLSFPGGFSHEQSTPAQSSSLGVEFWQEAFSPEFFQLGLGLAEDPKFYASFQAFLKLFLQDVKSLVPQRVVLIQEIQKILGAKAEKNTAQITWSAVSFATDRYFDEAASLNGWCNSDLEGIRGRWYQIMARAFLPSSENSQVDKDLLNNWVDDFLVLKNGSAEKFSALPAPSQLLKLPPLPVMHSSNSKSASPSRVSAAPSSPGAVADAKNKAIHKPAAAEGTPSFQTPKSQARSEFHAEKMMPEQVPAKAAFSAQAAPSSPKVDPKEDKTDPQQCLAAEVKVLTVNDQKTVHLSLQANEVLKAGKLFLGLKLEGKAIRLQGKERFVMVVPPVDRARFKWATKENQMTIEMSHKYAETFVEKVKPAAGVYHVTDFLRVNVLDTKLANHTSAPPGVKYYPNQIPPDSYKLGLEIAESNDFVSAHEKFFQSFLDDVKQLVSLRVLLIRSVDKVLNERSLPIGNSPQVLWSALSKVTDKQFEDLARQHSWNIDDADAIKTRWYEILRLCFVPAKESNTLDVSVLRNWKSDFQKLIKIESVDLTPTVSPEKPYVAPALDLKPRDITDYLDRYVIGQEQAKRVLAVAVSNHYRRRLLNKENPNANWQKSNVLLLGATGTGKTLLVETLAKFINVPCYIADATTMGIAVDALIVQLYALAGNDVEKTAWGIVYIDEFDKLHPNAQAVLMKLVENKQVQINFEKSVSTKNILFIAGGAFASITNDLPLKRRREVLPKDLVNFGLLPELVARFPDIALLEPSTIQSLLRILKEPKNSITEQYRKILELDACQLTFDDDALLAIAELAQKLGTGARGLKSIVDRLMLNYAYDAASSVEPTKITITRDLVNSQSESERSAEDRLITAVHEIGHALAATVCKNYPHELTKITAVSRSSLRCLASAPLKDRNKNLTKDELEAAMTVSLAGRAATELVLNLVDSDPQDDFEIAWALGRTYVMSYGMSKLGLFSFQANSKISPFLMAEIDKEVQSQLNYWKDKANAIILSNISLIRRAAEQLVLEGTIHAEKWLEMAVDAVYPEDVDKAISFSDVAGNEAAKAELLDFVRIFKNPLLLEKFQDKLPRGVLLIGEPGNGKTLLAKAFATECGAEFISASGSDFVERFNGVGASRIRELFAQARRKTPCVIFIDEVDAIGAKRGDGSRGINDFENTLNALLVELDGFRSNSGVVFIAATNRPDVLDPALLRPGRIDRQVFVQAPNEAARRCIFDLKLKGNDLEVGLDRDKLLEHLVLRTSGQNGAFCTAVAEEAVLLSLRRAISAADCLSESKETSSEPLHLVLNLEDFDKAFDKVLLGSRDEETDQPKLSFDEVAGNESAKTELMDVVRIFRNPKLLNKFKNQVPRGILLVGDPGNGKTLLAKALASECGARFISAAGSDFVELFVGQGASRVRDLFSKARRKTPCVVFIDEIDALGGKRNTTGIRGPGGGGREYDHALNSLLVELDGIKENAGILIVAATNQPDVLDPALLRPGRLDRQVVVQAPSQLARRQIFELNLKGHELDERVDKSALFDRLAILTNGKSGAYCASVIQEAILLGLRRVLAQADELRRNGASEEEADKMMSAKLTAEDFDKAIEKTALGTSDDADEPTAIRFAEVAGNEGAKADLMDVVNIFRNPVALGKFENQLPKGILLSGDPGNGKTLLAKALAAECGARFISAAGSDFVEIWVGQGAGRVRELFNKARQKAPCIVFIDEIDSLGARRVSGPDPGGAQRNYAQTLNALLVELDGFKPSDRVVVVGATNRPDMLDPALMRPGRFDRQITVEPPSRKARIQIFELNLAAHQLEAALDRNWLLEHLADRSAGRSGAFCAGIIQEAALLSVRRALASADALRQEGADGEEASAEITATITLADFDEAVDKVSFGSVNERYEGARTPEDIYNTAVHEVGHALIATLCKDYNNRLTKITVISRANHLGYMQSVPVNDRRVSLTREQIEASIMVSLGGRAATELVLQIVDCGPRGDFEKAWSLARLYVTTYGMSKLGIISIDSQTPVSPSLRAEIEKEEQELIYRLKEKTYAIISANISLIKHIAEILVKQETILADEWNALVSQAKLLESLEEQAAPN